MQSEVRADSNLFRVLSRALLGEGTAIRFRARGRSMFPAIADGDEIEIHPAVSARAGDVVLVESPEGLRTHRVVAVKNDVLVTRGDSCAENDVDCKADDVVGTVSSVICENGRGRRPHTLRTRLLQLWSRLRMQ